MLSSGGTGLVERRLGPMPNLSVLATAERSDGFFPGLEGLPTWFIAIVFALIIAGYLWNSRRRRDAAERHMTHDEWQAHLRANDPDMRREE
jgi:hypothetical protein